jgi:hypothetical protein
MDSKMHRRKRFPLGLALALAIASIVALPAAWAGQPDPVTDKQVEREADKVEREAEKTEREAEKAEGAKRSKGEQGKKKRLVTKAPCEERAFARVFKPWNDRALYTLAPGGDFETAAEGWTLEGATLAADSSTFELGAALGASSLELPAGATAVSPAICVERGFPSFRLVARSVSTEHAVVKVSVVYADGRTKKTGRLKPAAAWAVTRKLSLKQGRFRIRRGDSALVQLRFAVTAGTARIDDVYVDPRFSR